MKEVNYTIDSQRKLTDEVYEICLAGDTSAITTPGQFVNLRLEGFYLRRPLAVCDVVDGHLVLIYKIIGRGTDALMHMRNGEKLNLLVGLGNGYDKEKGGDHPLLIGGGVGGPSLYWLANELLKDGKDVKSFSALHPKTKFSMKMSSGASEQRCWSLPMMVRPGSMASWPTPSRRQANTIISTPADLK